MNWLGYYLISLVDDFIENFINSMNFSTGFVFIVLVIIVAYLMLF